MNLVPMCDTLFWVPSLGRVLPLVYIGRAFSLWPKSEKEARWSLTGPVRPPLDLRPHEARLDPAPPSGRQWRRPDHARRGLRGLFVRLLPALRHPRNDQLLQQNLHQAHARRPAPVGAARRVLLPRVRAARRHRGHRGGGPGVPAARGVRAHEQAHRRLRQGDPRQLEVGRGRRAAAGLGAAHDRARRVPGPVQGRQDLGDPERARRDHGRALQDHRQRARARREARRSRRQVARSLYAVQGVLQAGQEDQLVLRCHVKRNGDRGKKEKHRKATRRENRAQCIFHHHPSPVHPSTSHALASRVGFCLSRPIEGPVFDESTTHSFNIRENTHGSIKTPVGRTVLPASSPFLRDRRVQFAFHVTFDVVNSASSRRRGVCRLEELRSFFLSGWRVVFLKLGARHNKSTL